MVHPWRRVGDIFNTPLEVPREVPRKVPRKVPWEVPGVAGSTRHGLGCLIKIDFFAVTIARFSGRTSTLHALYSAARSLK